MSPGNEVPFKAATDLTAASQWMALHQSCSVSNICINSRLQELWQPGPQCSDSSQLLCVHVGHMEWHPLGCTVQYIHSMGQWLLLCLQCLGRRQSEFITSLIEQKPRHPPTFPNTSESESYFLQASYYFPQQAHTRCSQSLLSQNFTLFLYFCGKKTPEGQGQTLERSEHS